MRRCHDAWPEGGGRRLEPRPERGHGVISVAMDGARSRERHAAVSPVGGPGRGRVCRGGRPRESAGERGGVRGRCVSATGSRCSRAGAGLHPPPPPPGRAPASERACGARTQVTTNKMCQTSLIGKSKNQKAPAGEKCAMRMGTWGALFSLSCVQTCPKETPKKFADTARLKSVARQQSAPHFSRKAAHTRAYVARRPHIAQNVSMQRAARCSNPSARAAADALGHVAAGDGRLGGGGGGAGGGAEAGRDTRRLRGGERGVYKAMGRR